MSYTRRRGYGVAWRTRHVFVIYPIPPARRTHHIIYLPAAHGVGVTVPLSYRKIRNVFTPVRAVHVRIVYPTRAYCVLYCLKHAAGHSVSSAAERRAVDERCRARQPFAETQGGGGGGGGGAGLIIFNVHLLCYTFITFAVGIISR